MNDIDTSNWAEFRVGSIFEVTRPAPRAKLGYLDGDVPFVSTSSFNNGVSEWVDANGEELEDGECITVNALDGMAFWQPVAFLGRGGAGSSISILRRDGLNQYTGLFLAATITAACHASYNMMLSGTILREVVIRLPVTSAGDPDWDYMEQAMRDVFAQQERELDALTLLSAPRGTELDTTQWKNIPMSEVFEMKNTKSITAASLVPDSGTVPYVTSREGANGVQMYVDCPDEWLDKGECIMIGGKTLTFSYQKQDFCSNDSHNIALYSRASASKSEHCQLFLISALRASLEQIYSWGDSISMKRIKEDAVMLPVTAAGDPDWSYMEQTMRDAMAERDAALGSLQALAGV